MEEGSDVGSFWAVLLDVTRLVNMLLFREVWHMAVFDLSHRLLRGSREVTPAEVSLAP